MPLPIYLGLGLVAIYGPGVTSSLHGITVVPNSFKFGTIYQMWDNGSVNTNLIGDVVMFKEDDVVCRLALDGVQHTIMEQAKLVITEYYT
jgi:hypothetical protein